MTVKILTKEQLSAFAQNLIGTGRVVGVKRKENKFAFGDLSDASELVLDYDVTLGSPKVFFQPSKEKLVDFKVGKSTELKTAIESNPFVLFGVHTYDLKAINQMDRIWAGDNADEHYLARRRNVTIIAMYPARLSKWSFWCSMDASEVKTGYDLLLTDIGGKYAVEIGTDKGKSLLAKHVPNAENASDKDLELCKSAHQVLHKSCNVNRTLKVKADEITSLIRKNMNHPIWETQAKKCYSCGSCNLVCPTCYCFDVEDTIELDLASGSRSRKWDGCLLEDFAHVGSGENFREHRANRFRHRILRKMVYVPEKIGELACVGCGRCSEACLPDITDPVYVINTIKEGK